MYGTVFVERYVITFGSRRPVNRSSATLAHVHAMHDIFRHRKAPNPERLDDLLRRRAFPRTAPGHPGTCRRPVRKLQLAALVIEDHVRVVVAQRDLEASALEKFNRLLLDSHL